MRHKGSILLVCFVSAIVLAPIAQAQLSPDYASWDEGPEGFLLTKKEKKEWDKISTDAEAERFIELFWARRNPEPNASFNAFKAEFESKVQFADQNFGHGNVRGALSDRGRVLILMGRPDGRDLRASGQAPTAVGSVDPNTPTGRTDIWVYESEKLAKGFKAKGDQLLFMFFEERLDSNIFVLDRSTRESMRSQSALSRAPDVYFLHPNLNEIPKPVSIAGASPATAEHLAWLDGEDLPFEDLVMTLTGLGMIDGVNRPYWIHFELPPDAPQLDLIAGRVTGADGEVVSNFEMAPPPPIDGQYGAVYHLSFPLDEGTYTIEIVGAAGGEPQMARAFEAEISKVPVDGTWMSPLWLGITASPNPDAALGDPFTFGGWHLTPISGPELTRTSEIAYFGFIVRPELNEAGAVELEAKIQLKRDGKPLGRPLVMPLDSSNMFDDVYMFGNSIGLSALPETGDWEFEFKVTDTNSGTAAEDVLSIEITE
jgi:GWxTD domain-containing protein